MSRCPSCARLVASFTAIDHQCHEPVVLDPQRLSRIKTNTRRKIASQPRWRLLITPVRVAAAAAVVGGVFAVRLYHTMERHRTSPFVSLAEASAGDPAPENLAMLPAGASMEASAPMDNIARTAELVEMGNQAAAERAACDPIPCAKPKETIVAANPSPSPSPVVASEQPLRTPHLPYSAAQLMDFSRPSPFTAVSALAVPAPETKVKPGVELDAHVRHVWFVDDAKQPVAELQAMMPDLSEKLGAMLAEEGSAVSLEVDIEDRNLARLVDHFHSRGFGLVSAAAPQPNSSAGIVFTGKMIRYQIEIVEK